MLGLEWSDDKIFRSAVSQKLLEFIVNLEEKIIAIPEDKFVKMLRLVQDLQKSGFRKSKTNL